jgi:magnesium-transporting ATPase (P-type)
LESCSKFQGFDGKVTDLTKELKDSIQLAIENMANSALRTIIIAQKEIKLESKVVLLIGFTE